MDRWLLAEVDELTTCYDALRSVGVEEPHEGCVLVMISSAIHPGLGWIWLWLAGPILDLGEFLLILSLLFFIILRLGLHHSEHLILTLVLDGVPVKGLKVRPSLVKALVWAEVDWVDLGWAKVRGWAPGRCSALRPLPGVSVPGSGSSPRSRPKPPVSSTGT